MSRSIEEFTVCWTIRNFCYYDFEKDGDMNSTFFTPENIDGILWAVNIGCNRNDTEEYIFLGLHRYYSESIVTLDVEMELRNSENEILYSTEKRGVVFVGSASCLFSRVALLEELNKKLKDCPTDSLIVRCRMSMQLESEIVQKSLSRSCTMETTVCFDTLSFIRRVWYAANPMWSKQLTFLVNGTALLEVNIKAPQDDILFKISRKSNGIPPKMKCEITLLNQEGEKNFTSSEFFRFSKKFPNWHFPLFLKRSMLKRENVDIYIKFTFSYLSLELREFVVKETKAPNLPSTPKVYKKMTTGDSLSSDLREMLLSKKHADVSFCLDGEVICAHKNILSSRSPVFSAMFDQQIPENETEVIDITDMNVQTLKLFLKFLFAYKILIFVQVFSDSIYVIKLRT